MKYAFIIPDGMGDFPIEKIGKKTPVEYAFTPNLDLISKQGEMGVCKTTPDGFSPGSDVCISSLLGYDPNKYYSGRAPFEAKALNIEMSANDLVMRLNLINIDNNNNIVDHSAGHISTQEATELIKHLQKNLSLGELEIFPGISYRHIITWKNKPDFHCKMTPPHDIPGQNFHNYLPEGADAQPLIDIILKSTSILEKHPINILRKKQNKKTANLIWPWGNGYTPQMETFSDKFKVNGAVISAVALIQGLSKFIKLTNITVPGITAHFDTDYEAKGRYAIRALQSHDLIIVHIEAPDEAGHISNIEEKIKSIERIDKYIIGPLYEHLNNFNDYRILISPDHYTPIEKRIHVANPVPYTICGTGITKASNKCFSEKNAKETGISFSYGHHLMPYFLNLKK